MNPFEFVIVLVVIVMAGKIIQARLSTRDVGSDRGSDPATVHMRDEVRALTERIQVLERVVTDTHGSQHLDREIERLRDR